MPIPEPPAAMTTPGNGWQTPVPTRLESCSPSHRVDTATSNRLMAVVVGYIILVKILSLVLNGEERFNARGLPGDVGSVREIR